MKMELSLSLSHLLLRVLDQRIREVDQGNGVALPEVINL